MGAAGCCARLKIQCWTLQNLALSTFGNLVPPAPHIGCRSITRHGGECQAFFSRAQSFLPNFSDAVFNFFSVFVCSLFSALFSVHGVGRVSADLDLEVGELKDRWAETSQKSRERGRQIVL